MQQPEEKNLDPASGPDTINLLDYLEVVVKRWRMIVKVMAVAFALSAGLSLLFKNIYSSTAMIIPPQKDSLMGLLGGLMGTGSGGGGGGVSGLGELLGKGSASDLYIGMLNSGTIKDRIIDRFKLMQLCKTKYRLDAYKVLDKMVDISSGKKDGIISITVEDKDPKLATDMANAFVDELGKLMVQLNVSGAGQNNSYLDNRINQVKVDLAKAEEALKNFQSRTKALDVPAQAQATIQGVAALKAQLATQEAQLSSLRSHFTDSAQEVKDIKASIGNIRGQIGQLEGTGGGASSIPSVGSVPALGQEYVRLLREFKVQEATLEALVKMREMTRLSEEKNASGLQILQQATVPDKKIKPKRSVMVLLFTFVAGFGAVLYAFILEVAQSIPTEDREQLCRIRGMLPNPMGIFSLFKRGGRQR